MDPPKVGLSPRLSYADFLSLQGREIKQNLGQLDMKHAPALTRYKDRTGQWDPSPVGFTGGLVCASVDWFLAGSSHGTGCSARHSLAILNPKGLKMG